MENNSNSYKNFTRENSETKFEEEEEYDNKLKYLFKKQHTTFFSDIVQENKNQTEADKADNFKDLWRVFFNFLIFTNSRI